MNPATPSAPPTTLAALARITIREVVMWTALAAMASLIAKLAIL